MPPLPDSARQARPAPPASPAPPVPPAPPAAPAPAGSALCPGCAEPHDPEDRFCGNCGTELAALPAPSVPGPARTPEPTPAPGRAPAEQPSAAGRGRRTGSGRDSGRDSGQGSGHGSRRGSAPAPAAGNGEPDATPTDSFLLAPPKPAGDATLPLGLAVPPGRDPEGRAETAEPPGPGGPGTAAPAEAGDATDAGAGAAGIGDAGAGPAAPADPRAAARQEPAPEPAGAVCVACGIGGVDADGYCERCGHAQPRQRDHQELELTGGAAAVSDRGLRHHRNEDAFALAGAPLPDGTHAIAAVVCDGVSTAYRPDDASAAAAAAGSRSLLGELARGTEARDAMRTALLTAFDAVVALAGEERPAHAPQRNSPACTCVSAVVAGPVFTVGWIGDSRAYWVPDDRAVPPARLTEDDSWAARMVAAGLMGEAEAYADERAHAITGWLGADAVEVDPHVAAFQPDGPGVVVVCTDGLWNYAESAADMAAALPADARTRPLAAARALLGVALDGGGHDNVTVALLPFPADASGAESPSA